MKYVYAHLPQNEDIGFEERSYSVTEGLLEYQGRSVLYLHVDASDVNVTRWKYETNEKGEALSEIEPVTDDEGKRTISDLLRTSLNIATVNFF